MKITITIPKEVYDKLERDRGMIPRSTYLQKLIQEGDFSQEGPKLDTEDRYEIKERVVVKPRKELPKEVPKEVKELERKGLPTQDIDGFETFFKR